jgi:hypothetical protein
MRKTNAGGRIGGRRRTYCSKRARSGVQPAGAMALDMIDNINVSLARGASRAQKLRAAARAGKAGATTARSRLSYCGLEVTGGTCRCGRIGAGAEPVDNALARTLPMGNGTRIEDRKWPLESPAIARIRLAERRVAMLER